MRYWLAVLLAACGCRGRGAAPAAPPEDTRRAPAVADAPAVAPCPDGVEVTLCRECAAGSAASCTKVAYGVHGDLAGRPWYQRGCDGGDPGGCDGLASTYVIDMAPDSHEKFVAAQARYYELARAVVAKQRAACGPADEEACVSAGIAFDVGHPVQKDAAVGSALLEGSCGRAYARACMVLSQEEARPRAERAKWARAGCLAGEERTCGDLVGVFDHPPLDPAGGFAFAQKELERRCRAKDAAACWVLGGVWLQGAHSRAQAVAALNAAVALDPSYTEDRDRVKHGGPFLRDLGPLPTLELKPLEMELAKHRRAP